MRIFLLCTLLAALAPPARADSLRCGDRLVSDEALAAEVLAACGEPDYRDVWSPPVYGNPVSDEQVWTYNFGPSQLLRLLHFRHGRLTTIESDGYGFDREPAAGCRPTDLTEGLSKYRLLARCGEPTTQESYGVMRPLRRRDGSVVTNSLLPVYRERWVYNLGPQYFLQLVTIENGRVTAVASGARGSATPRD